MLKWIILWLNAGILLCRVKSIMRPNNHFFVIFLLAWKNRRKLIYR